MRKEKLKSANAVQPLIGMRVVDFSRLLPGPWCANLLGGLGAEVVKVEAPEGDPSRHNPPFNSEGSVYFDGVNCNKHSIALDPRTEAGRNHAASLIAGADVVIESFRTGVADKLGVGYERAKALNPRVVYCSISGFGRCGSLTAVPGHDLIIQALSGILGVDGREGETLRVPAFQAGDYAAAAFAAISILAALVGDPKARQTRYLDISMLDSLLAMGGINFTAALSRRGGGSGMPQLQAWGRNPRYSIYRTKDGRSVAVCLLEKHLWRNFCLRIGRADLITESETPSDRHSDHGEAGEAYRKAIGDYCAGMSLAEHQATMINDGVPIAPVLTPDEVLATDFIRERDMVMEFATRNGGAAQSRLTNPLVFLGLAMMAAGPAPSIDEHRAEIVTAFRAGEAEAKKA